VQYTKKATINKQVTMTTQSSLLLLRLVQIATLVSSVLAFAGISTTISTNVNHNNRYVPTTGSTKLHASSSSSSSEHSNATKKRVVIIGGGWAGYSATESLSQNPNIEIILLDASSKARGGLAGGYRESISDTGTGTGSGKERPVEAGIHGFWREYRNTFDMMDNMIEGVEIDNVLGDYTPCALFSKSGKVALAPVLGNNDNDTGNDNGNDNNDNNNDGVKLPPFPKGLDEASIRQFLADQLPPPLDLALLAEFDPNSKSQLSPIDRISAIGLLGAWADFEQESKESWERYDTIPASVLFEKAGVTEGLYEELVSPLLHVLPMCPAYDCSAAAALSCFHVFALQSRGAFDVRWCNGSISEQIFGPWQDQLEGRGVVVKGGSRVLSINHYDNDGDTVEADVEADVDVDVKSDRVAEEVSTSTNTSTTKREYKICLQDKEDIDCDAIILAVGGTAMGKIAASSPAISSLEASKDFDKLRGVTCVAVRLFLQPDASITDGLGGGLYDKTQLPPDMAQAMKDSPVAVCGANIGGIQELKETGFCIYDLQRMHKEFSIDENSATSENDGGNADADEDEVAVLEVDFYRADDLANMSNDEIANIALEAVAATLGTKKINMDRIIDLAVVRARNAVSHFSPKSAIYSPGVKLDDKGHIYICGDWVDRSGHASWSTEKAVVTGRQAADRLSQDWDLQFSHCDVIPAAEDTAQLSALRKSARLLRTIAPLPNVVPPSPWVFAKEFLSQR